MNPTSSSVDAWPPPGLSSPARRALAGAGIGNPQQLAARTQREVLALHGLEPKAPGPLRAALAAAGLSFAPPQELK